MKTILFNGKEYDALHFKVVDGVLFGKDYDDQWTPLRECMIWRCSNQAVPNAFGTTLHCEECFEAKYEADPSYFEGGTP